MKKLLFAFLSLSAASFAFAGGAACKADAKCDDKDAKACCCCPCCGGAKDDKACAIEKADHADDAKKDAAPAATPDKK